MTNNDHPSNRWYVLTLAALTLALGYAAPSMCMPVLFKEISNELGLNLVQVGTIWGVISFCDVKQTHPFPTSSYG